MILLSLQGGCALIFCGLWRCMHDLETTLLRRRGSLNIKTAAAAALLAFAPINFVVTMANGQTVPPNPAPSQEVGDVPRAGSFVPGLDDVMNMLIQPRHIKLYYAGSYNNWELASFELQELRSSFRRAAQTVPKYLDNDLDVALKSFMEPTFRLMDAAINTGNRIKFNEAYAKLTEGCNACHAFLEHPFIVIGIPNAAVDASKSDQRFTTQ